MPVRILTAFRRQPRWLSSVSHHAMALAMFGSGIAAVPAAAQTQPAPMRLPPISVESQTPEEDYTVERPSSPKYTQPLRETPQTITVVPKVLMEERGATTMRDALRNVPGISIGAAEGGVPLGDNLTIRGFSARSDIFIDGVRDLGNSFRDPFNLDRVEVIKGPASAYSGRGSTGGSINQVSKTPFLGSINDVFLTGGSDSTKRMSADVNQPLTGLGLDNVAFRANVLAHDGEIAGRNEVEKQRWGFAPSLAFGLGTPTEVTVEYFHLSQDNVPDYGHPFVNGSPVDVSRDNFYGLVARDYEESETDMFTAKVDHRFSESLKLRNVLRYGISTSDYIASQPSFSNGASFSAGTISRNSKSRDSEDTFLINQTDVTSNFRLAGFGNTLVTGVEVAQENQENRLRTNNVAGPVTSLFMPNPFDAGPGVSYTGARNEGDAFSVALYMFDTIALSPQWDLTGGVRWDRIDTETVSFAANGARSAFGRVDSELSWRSGLVYKPLPYGSIYAVYGTSFNPSGERLSVNANNRLLDPESNETYEVGTKWDLMEGALSLTGAVFRVDKTNARTDDPSGQAVQVLQGKQRVDGFEIGFAGNITPRWKVFGGYTRLAARVIESGDPNEVGTEAVNVSPHSFTFWTTYETPWRVQVGLGAQLADERKAGNAESSFAGTSRNRVQGYAIFDAMLAYHLTDKIDLRLNVLNLTDEFYYEGVYSSMVVPGPARTFLLSTSLRF